LQAKERAGDLLWRTSVWHWLFETVVQAFAFWGAGPAVRRREPTVRSIFDLCSVAELPWIEQPGRVFD